MKTIIFTKSAPAPLGPYSQAVKVGSTIYLAGQIGLDQNQNLVAGIKEQTKQVFANMKVVCEEAGGDLDQIVKLTIYLINFADFPAVNEIMQSTFREPYPARTTIQISKLPKDALIEIEGICSLD